MNCSKEINEKNGKPYQTTNDDESEEMFVYINFEGLMEEYSDEELKNFKILGLDTKEPILQIGSRIFAGSWKDVIGTATFFEETEEVPKKCFFSPDISNPLKFATKTEKSLYMKRVFVTSKKEHSRESLEVPQEEISIDVLNN